MSRAALLFACLLPAALLGQFDLTGEKPGKGKCTLDDGEFRNFILTRHAYGMDVAQARCYGRLVERKREFLTSVLSDQQQEPYRENVVLLYGLTGAFPALDDLKSFVLRAEPGYENREVSPALYRMKVNSVTAIGLMLNSFKNDPAPRDALRAYFTGLLEKRGWGDQIRWKSPFHERPEELELELLTAAFEAMGLSGDAGDPRDPKDASVRSAMERFVKRHTAVIDSSAGDPLRYSPPRPDWRPVTMSREQLESLVEAAKRAIGVNEIVNRDGLEKYYSQAPREAQR